MFFMGFFVDHSVTYYVAEICNSVINLIWFFIYINISAISILEYATPGWERSSVSAICQTRHSEYSQPYTPWPILIYAVHISIKIIKMYV